MFKLVDEALNYLTQYEIQLATYTKQDVIYIATYSKLTEELIRQCADVIDLNSPVFNKFHNLKVNIIKKSELLM